MSKVLLSLTPLAAVRPETHAPTGLVFQIAPLSAEEEAEIQRQCTSVMGVFDQAQYNAKVCERCIKGWEGFGVEGQTVQLTEENMKLFLKHHAQNFGPWIVVKAKSYDHYRSAEVEAAKKG